MNRYNASKDLLWTSEGDIFLDQINGKARLADTEKIHFRSILQKIKLILGSEAEDWRLQTSLTGGLAKFAGRPNTREVGEEIRSWIINVLTRSNVVAMQDLQVAIFPIGANQLGGVITVNSGDQRGQIFVSATYDLRDNKLVLRNV